MFKVMKYMNSIQRAIAPVARGLCIDPDSIKVISQEGNRLIITGRVDKYQHQDILCQAAQKAVGGKIKVLNQIEIR